MNYKNLQLTSTLQFKNKEEIEHILNIAEKMSVYTKGEKYTDILKDKIIATLFYEPSTRTKLSFQTACQRLGAKIISTEGMENSSMKKGETLEDTIRVISQYADMIIMRHPEKGSADIATQVTDKPFINAGDGPGQHPTQALLDMFTIRKEKGKIDGIKVAMVGDLKFGRTVHSLTHLLKHYDIELIFISPKELRMPEYILEELIKAGINYSETENFEEGIKNVDVIYMTRVQEERFKDKEEYKRLKDLFILNDNILSKAKKDFTVMHPLPRLNEIPKYVDSHNSAAYFKQTENGVLVRMALIALAFGVEGRL